MPPHDPPTTITEIYVYLADEADGTQGICAFMNPRNRQWMPMFCQLNEEAKRVNLDRIARKVVEQTGRQVSRVKFRREEISEVFTPFPSRGDRS